MTQHSTAWRRLLSGTSRWAASAIILTACSCSSVQRPTAKAGRDPFLEEAGPRSEAQATLADSTPRTPAPRPVSVSRTTANGRVQQVAYDGAADARSEPAIQRTASEARLSMACPPSRDVCDPCVEEAGHYPDEYLCDGGDRDLPVHYQNDRLSGLETEDTIVEYRGSDGQRRVKPANKVCIYAPRFGSVVAVSAPIEDIGGGRPTQAVVNLHGVGLRNREVAVADNQREMTERFVTRSRSSGLINDSAAEALDRPEAIHGHVHTTHVFENLTFLRNGQLTKSEGAVIEKRVQAAAVWTRDQNPVIVAKDEGAQELRSPFNVAELVGRENRFNGKGRLRIVKLADREVAAQGDVITFTLRFDNIGDRELTEVVLVDNLTPRLEYVDDSATLDLDGRLVTENNGEGSLILRWELEKPLAGRTGGVATFQARVR